MDEFDSKAHARLVGNVLIAMGVFAWMIALAGLIPDTVFALPPHFFGSGGAAAIGLLLAATGFAMRK